MSPTTPTPASGLPKTYTPADHEPRITAAWDASHAFHVDPARVTSGAAKPYAIFIPPPNVTAALHLGHALNNTLQDTLIRAHRMMGFEALWMPGTDHAGIATQAVVEKRVLKEEGKRRQAFGREEFVAKIQAFKDEYEATITTQLKAMGCSCDWERQRFTMDPQCAAAVREAFFRLFKDGLIYRGKRLVNWDPVLQTAVADDECYDEEIDAGFYYLRYPLVHRKDPTPTTSTGRLTAEDVQPVTWSELATRGYPHARQHPPEQQAWITVATTRPETYLGDTGVAINPKDPRAKALRGLMVELPLVGRIIPIVEDDYVVLPAAMQEDPEAAAKDPKAQYATGFLKVTPAHDPNDWEIGLRHKLAAINVMAPDATISDKHGWSDPSEHRGAHVFIGKKREEARKLTLKEFEARGLLEGQKPYRHSVKHSDRSKAIVEPYLSDQWYVRVTDPRFAASANAALVPQQRTEGTERRSDEATKGRITGAEGASLPREGVAAPRAAASLPRAGTSLPREGASARREGASLPGERASAPREEASALGNGASAPLKKTSAAADNTSADGDGSLTFYPARYAKTYEQWHTNIRDWCISRQLWWGHRIPVWSGSVDLKYLGQVRETINGDLAVLAQQFRCEQDYQVRIEEGTESARIVLASRTAESDRLMCALSLATSFEGDDARVSDGGLDLSLRWQAAFNAAGLTEALKQPAGEILFDHFRGGAFCNSLLQDPDVLDTWFSSALWPLSTLGWPDPAKFPGNEGMLDAFNPSSVLCTAREIITLWVSRMVMFNRYFRGSDEGTERRSDEGGNPKAANPSPSAPPSVASSLRRSVASSPVPFRDVFIHAMIMDGEGRKMSKTLGNGVDPRDIIESHGSDAMRFTLVQMTTNTQDVRMPVQKDSRPGGAGKNTSPKFDNGRNFCNKLWNTTRFALDKLGKSDAATQRRSDEGEGAKAATSLSSASSSVASSLRRSVASPDLSLLDRWMLSRLASTTQAVNRSLANYEFSDYAEALYKVLWWDLCDWYLEGIKPTVDQNPAQQAVLAHALETIVRLLHPIAPFITEAIWEKLKDARQGTAAIEGITLGPSRKANLLCTAGWPEIDPKWIDAAAEQQFEQLRELVNAIRNIRSDRQVPPKRKITLHCTAAITQMMKAAPGVVEALAGLEAVLTTPPTAGVPAQAFRAAGIEMHLTNLADAAMAGSEDSAAEKDRLTKHLEALRKSEVTLSGRLNNPGYLERAPAKLVEESKAQLAKIHAEIAAIEAQLKAL